MTPHLYRVTGSHTHIVSSPIAECPSNPGRVELDERTRTRSNLSRGERPLPAKATATRRAKPTAPPRGRASKVAPWAWGRGGCEPAGLNLSMRRGVPRVATRPKNGEALCRPPMDCGGTVGTRGVEAQGMPARGGVDDPVRPAHSDGSPTISVCEASGAVRRSQRCP